MCAIHQLNVFLQGARIYAIQAYNNESAAKSFWSKLAALTGGKHMKMDKFGFIVDIMMAICYREHGAEFFDVSIMPEL